MLVSRGTLERVSGSKIEFNATFKMRREKGSLNSGPQNRFSGGFKNSRQLPLFYLFMLGFIFIWRQIRNVQPRKFSAWNIY